MINEAGLFSAARAGDVEAFEKLIEVYNKKVYSMFLNLCGDKDYANELTQEVFVKVYRSIRHLEKESTFPVLVYKTTRDVCLKAFKTRKAFEMVISGKNL